VERGLQCLILVPEIGLTSQMVARVRSRLPSPAIIHSELGAGERYDIWRGIRDGRYPVVVGTRSAVFAPLQRLGLVVIDEEHDRSFKQSEGHPLYHGRDVAIYRARSCGAPVVLGSATPSAESYHHAREGKYRLFTLDQRVGGAAVPAIEMVDSRSAESAILTPSLELALRDCLASGGQAMLLLNRRGFSPSIQCRACGQVLRCVNCSVGLSYHRTSNRLLCHYCGYARALDASCPQCRAPDLSARGVGIQRLHHELQALLPQTRVLRMDSDATASKGAHDRILSQFQEGRAQVLLGTQMIAKGHHFPAVTLAGIVSLDELLGLPDFRSEERVFQLATQMAGRAGRGRNPGRVLVQTMQPDAPLMRQIRDHDYRGFISQQLATRREAGYPPYSNLALVTVAAATPEDAQRRASAIAASLQDGRRGLTVLGPAPAAIACLRGRHRWQVLVKASERPVLHRCLEPVAAQRRPEPGVTVTVDIDPAATL
jgi:primosomal protein N' (replication factor Y)